MGKHLRIFNAVPTRQSKIAYGLLLALLALMLIIPFTTPLHRWGDASTYYMQISSISEDFDIEYSPEDIQRVLENKFDDLPAGLFLIKTDSGHYYYGKEYSYALFAAPFYSIFGDQGIILFNALLFWLMILMGYLYIRRTNTDLIALGVSTAFFLLSAAFVYIFWIHVEIYNMFLITAGIFFWLKYRHSNNYKFLMITAVIFGIATVAKLPNCLMFAPIACYELHNTIKNLINHKGQKNIQNDDGLSEKNKCAFLMLALFLVPIVAFYGFFYLSTGATTFYGGERLYYAGKYPFIDGYDVENEAGRLGFSVEKGRISALIIDIENLKVIPYNIFYYLFGRFTGIVWFYPFTLFATIPLILGFARVLAKPSKYNDLSDNINNNKENYLILLGITLNILFFIVIIGNNYLGGVHAVGNRYFYIYPAFLFLIGTIDLKKLIPFILVAMVTVGPVIADPIKSSTSPDTYTYEFPYLYAPIEYSQLNNLPFWSHSHSFDGLLAYRIDDQSRYYKDGFLVNDGIAEFLIRPKGDINDIALFILPYQTKSPIYLSYSGCGGTQIINNQHGTLIALSNMTPVYSDNRYSVYRFSIASNRTAWIRPIQLSDEYPLQFTVMGWHGEENWNGIPTRWMSQNATLLLYAEEPGPAVLQFRALSYHRERTLYVYHGNNKIGEEIIPRHFTEIRVPLYLQEGMNVVRLEVPEGCNKPSEVGSSADARCLSIAVQEISLKRGIIQETGWYGEENWNGIPTRWMSQNATLTIPSSQKLEASLGFRAQSFLHPRTVEISVNGDVIEEILTIPWGMVNFTVPLQLEKGFTTLKFSVREGCARPYEHPQLQSSDTRCLSIAVQNITLTL